MNRISVLSLVLALPTAAVADPCAEEVAALFSGGALDPFVRPNRRETTVTRHPDGTETPSNEVVWDGTRKSINHQNGTYYLAIGTKAWQGTSFDGPWTFAGDMGDFDPDALTRDSRDSMAANLTDPRCEGEVDLEGRALVKYVYRTRTDPNTFGSWWGGLYTVYVDPATGQMARLELAEGIASWAPEPATTVSVTTVVYDESITIEEPAE